MIPVGLSIPNSANQSGKMSRRISIFLPRTRRPTSFKYQYQNIEGEKDTAAEYWGRLRDNCFRYNASGVYISNRRRTGFAAPRRPSPSERTSVLGKSPRKSPTLVTTSQLKPWRSNSLTKSIICLPAELRSSRNTLVQNKIFWDTKTSPIQVQRAETLHATELHQFRHIFSRRPG